MRSYSSGSLWPSGRPQAGPATQALVATLVLASLVASFSQRRLGFGTQELIFDSAAVLDLELWRLVTYAFIKTANPFALLFSAAILWLFGCAYEKSWGSRDFVRFFFASSIGAAILCIPLSIACNWLLPFDDLARAEGPDAVIDAMLVALAMNAPDASVMFGFILPVRAKSLVGLLLGMQVISGIMTGAATLGMTLGGMIMGWLLVSGAWRPRVWLDRLRLWRMRRRRHGLYVVPPKGRRHMN
jgi:membrane associated rhomboid family serine protease